MESLLARRGGARVSHRLDDRKNGLELLASGLVFDLTGLASGASQPVPPGRHFFGLPEQSDRFAFEAISLMPGRHVAAGAAMIPLVRVMTMLALTLSALPGLRAVAWHPAGSWMDVGYFTRIIQAWLAGGAFPALGLAAMVKKGGGIESEGLRFFTGQELRVEAPGGTTDADMVKLAVRTADLLVQAGRFDHPQEIRGPEGRRLLVEPSPDGRIVRLRPVD